LEATLNGIFRPPQYEGVKPQEIQKIEEIRQNLARTVLPVIGMARTIASRFSFETVDAKVTGEWLLKKAKVKFPEVATIIESHGERGMIWLEKQAKEIREFITGRIAYNSKQGRLVKICTQSPKSTRS